MGERERNEQGQYVETVTRERVLDSLREGGHVMTAVEVGDDLGCTPEAVNRKLSELFKDGEVNRKEVGAHAVVWWLPDDETTTPDELADQAHERAAEAFAQRAQDALGDSIHELVLFGSTVRGETRGRNSDVDMFVVLDSTDHDDELNEIAFDVTLEYGVAVSVHTQPKERFEHRKNHPFVNQVLTEGRSYA
jgi:predicted nucleotidyltransferase